MNYRDGDRIEFLTKAYEQACAQRDELLEQQHLWVKSKREWQGLTHDEILETYGGPDGSDYVDYARGIEAKLKGKNT